MSGNSELFIHESSYVDDGVTIGEGTRVWHFCHLLPGTTIGRGCSLGQNVMAGPNVVIGDNVKIQNNVSIYHGVTLEDDVFVGPSVVFTNVRTPRSAFPRNRPEDHLPTIVRRGASLGANSTILCGVIIGEYALIGAGAVVTRNIPPHAVMVGNPGRQQGWACECGEVLTFDAKLASCPTCERQYRELNDNAIERLSVD